ncbi:MAG: VOC family protein [Pseudomonadota bacterium]
MTPHGTVHWSELMTRDTAAAIAFFEEVAGWRVEPMPMPDGTTYHLAHAGEVPVAGIFDGSDPMFDGLPPHWMTYIAVDDVDAACERAKGKGGEVRRVFDVSGVGRIAIIVDPTGGVVGLMTPADQPG